MPALVVAALLLGAIPSAHAASAIRTVRYHGYALQVPRTWPVFHLTARSRTCVRFNRHAVYVGTPGADQICPPGSIGHSEAILVQPFGSAQSPVPASGSAMRLRSSTHRVIVTATWDRRPGVIRRALGVRALRATVARVSHTVAASPLARASKASPRAASPGAVFNGLGFDTCSTPSTSTMSAWRTASPFRAIGVYIGGVNAACHNLTASWVTTESAAGWGLIPIYVGLQAPGACSGCSAIQPANAAAEGTAAAANAVAEAQALGLGPGNPIYDDMEAYTRSTVNTRTVLQFLSAWTAGLHAAGYLSGVYSSEASGIADLVAAFAGGVYAEPDEIWFANWNNSASVADSAVPTAYWPNGRRLHQYSTGTVTYGGYKLDVDRDYVDAATAAAGAAVTAANAAPAATRPPSITGIAAVGQTLAVKHANWTEYPTAYSYQWERCNPDGSDCQPILGATGARYTLTSVDLGSTLEVTEAASNLIGTAPPIASNASLPVLASTGGYRLITAFGNVYNSAYETFYGSPSGNHVAVSTIVGMATRTDDRGYWLVTTAGKVYRYGAAAAQPAVRARHLVRGIVASGTGGYWLFTAFGNVYNSKSARWYGSLSAARVKTRSIVGMALAASKRGYWLVNSAGKVYRYGNAASLPAIHPANPIRGIIAAPQRGYWLYTAQGNVYASKGAHTYGSPARAGIRTAAIVGMLATPDGRGYWLVTRTGTVYSYGDAATYPTLTAAHPVIGF